MINKKACIITGATGGIGSVMCREFSKAGWTVIGTSADERTEGLICDEYLQANALDIVRESEFRKQFCSKLRSYLKGETLCCIINNAATQILGSIPDLTVDMLQESLDVNVVAPFAFVSMFLDELRASKGTVINIGSVHAQATKAGFSAYSTSKSALHGLTRSLSLDLGPDVRVNTLAPAATATPMLMAGFAGNTTAFKKLSSVHPLRRIAQPEEVAKAALFLAGDASSFMTGSTVFVDGGVLSRLYDPD